MQNFKREYDNTVKDIEGNVSKSMNKSKDNF